MAERRVCGNCAHFERVETSETFGYAEPPLGVCKLHKILVWSEFAKPCGGHEPTDRVPKEHRSGIRPEFEAQLVRMGVKLAYRQPTREELGLEEMDS